MQYLNKKIIKELKDTFKGLKKEVTLKFFTQEIECRFCKETRGLLQEISEVTDKIKVEIFDFIKDKDIADEYGIDKIPATVVLSDEDKGIRFFGIPSGYEFGSLIEAIKLVSTGDNTISEETKKFLDSLSKDVHLQVFVTPTCPYCPGAVILGHQMAYYSPKVKSDMVEATEFPELSVKYSVMGVPRTIINESEFQEGAAPEQLLVEKIKASLAN
jgi:glutaredoxin-like protein